jgi:AsmA protein
VDPAVPDADIAFAIHRCLVSHRLAGFDMKPLKIAVLGFATVLALASLGLVFGVPAGFLAKRVQDQIEINTGYRLRINGDTKLAFRPSPTVTLTRISLHFGNDSTTGFAAESVRVSVSLASLFSGRPGITEVAIVKPVVRAPLLRQRGSRARDAFATPRAAWANAMSLFTVDRLIVEDGTVVMSNALDGVETRIDRIALTASLAADEGRLEAYAYADDQPIRLQVTAKSPLPGFDGANVPVDFSFAAPGFLKGTLTGVSDVRFAGSILRINGLAGKIGTSKLNGWLSLDLSSKLLVKGDFDVQRLDLVPTRPPATGGAVSAPSGRAQSQASRPWSSQLNYVDAEVQFSAAELNVGTFRFAPISVNATLANGVLSAALSHTGMYGGQVGGIALIDVSGRAPVHAFHIDLRDARALQVLSDVAGFEALDGRLQAKLDVRASGESERELMSSLSGTVDARIQDGQILGINVPKMIRTLTAKTLTGWQESHAESTDLSDLSASFRIEDGRAASSNLRLLGPLVRINGSGSIDLAAKTVRFKLDPKLVASLQGQGGAPDPLGFGVPVNVEGSWSDPRVYLDVAGILSDPDDAYAKLNALGQGLFGKGKGGLDALMQGLGTLLGPRNEGRDDRRPPAGAKPSDRPDANGAMGDFLRELFSR